MTRHRRDAGVVALVAGVVRGVVVAWGASRFPAVADGAYYQKLATRLAEGQGYTWLWPDGVVTYAAHYPVGYPAVLAAVYRAFGPSVLAASLVNAALGVAASVAAWALAARSMPRRAALAAGLLVAVDPALVAYTPAVMTEGVTAALVTIAAWLVAVASESEGKRRLFATSALAVAMGIATLVRPQSLLLAPAFGALVTPRGPRRTRERVVAACAIVAGALLVCAPWTVRNCVHMGRCALVSVNGGWNLLIGVAPGATGHWSPVDVPSECRTVFDEAGKDACFGRSAVSTILADPLRFLRLVPAKLSATFDYCGAAPWYLHEANPDALTERGKVMLGAAETVFHRLVLVAALVALGKGAGPRGGARKVVAGVGVASALLGALGDSHRGGALAYLCLAFVALLHGRRLASAPTLVGTTAAAVLATAAVHAVFFGAGRYGMVVFPLVTAMTGALLTGLPAGRDTAHHAAD